MENPDNRNARSYFGAIQPAQVQTFLFADDGAIPNHPTLPLLVYTAALALSDSDLAAACEALYEANGWGGTWRNGIFTFPHYHSIAHEALAICRGQARVQMGGEAGQILEVRAGDVMILPAGCGHKNLGASADLLVVGAYPPGQTPDLCYGKPEERPQALANIARVPLPESDPIYGTRGPLLTHWHRRATS
jgi:uncharacterized protein YjlB